MITKNLQFRLATQDDAEKLHHLIQAAFRAEDSREGWVGNADLASSFSLDVKDIMPTITNPDSAFLIATDNNDTLIGSIGVSRRGPDGARLFMLAVDQQHNRGGIGRQVLAHGEDYCQQTWNATKLALNALSTREALVSWYMRRGYRKTGETTPFPRKEFNGLTLPDDMCFVELEKDLSPVSASQQAA